MDDKMDLSIALDRSNDAKRDPLLAQRLELHAKEVRALLALMVRKQLGDEYIAQRQVAA